MLKKTKNQIKIQLEKIRERARERGLDVESFLYKKEEERIEKELLNKLGVSNNEIEIDKLKDLIIKIQKEPKRTIDWSEVVNKPEIKEYDDLTLITEIKKIKKNVKNFRNKVAKETDDKIKKILSAIPLKHIDLSGIGKDDHHNEKHDLESHTNSDLLEEVYRLVGGGEVDDLHTHKKEKIKETRTNAGLWNPMHFHNDVYYTKAEVNALIVAITGFTLTAEILPFNGVDTVFAVTKEPVFVLADGQGMINGSGYTYGALQITFDNAPVTQAVSFYNG